MKVHILHLEDDPLDSELTMHLLEADGMETVMDRVQTLANFEAGLADRKLQLILSDYTIPGVNALEALRLARETRPEIPFVFLSGTIGEERAIEALKRGATDYVLKDHATRLGAILRRALQEAEDRLRRKEGEKALAKTTSRLNGIVTSAMDAIISIDADQRVVLFNPAAEKMFGVAAEAAMGKSINEFIPVKFRAVHSHHVEAFGHTGISNRSMGHLSALSGLRTNGEEFPIEASISQTEVDGEKLFTVILRDITQRKKAEEALLRNAEHLRLFIAHAPASIAMFDQDMRYIAASQRWLTDYHLTEQTIIGHSHYEVFPELSQRWKEIHNRCLAGAVERSEEDLFQRADGTRQWVRWEVRPWYSDPETVGGITIFSEEITERKLAQEALQQSEERFRTLADAIPQLACIAEPDGHIIWYNRRWYDYTGTTPSQMEGWGWQNVHDPAMLPKVLAQWNESIATGSPFEMVFPLRGADGRFRPFLTRVMPLKDEQGRVMQWFGTNTDITAQKEFEAELERVVKERTVRLNETIGELEAFSYSLSHDMRAPLRAISAYAHIILEDHRDQVQGPVSELVQKVVHAGERMDHLITDVLELTRVSRVQIHAIAINMDDLIRQIREERPEMQTPKAEITIQSPLGLMQGDLASLTQCLTNLLSNAIKYVPRGVTPKIRIWTEKTGSPASFVRLWIADNGIGIPPGDQKKIFEMFHRLNPQDQYEGTGIGLAIARKAVERMGGRLGVESQPGQGSQFWVELPKAE